jgi:hypothetical protein
MRIDMAFCRELNRTVDIYQACLEFSNQTQFSRFTFFCSDPECRASRPGGVRVTAVNHHRLPEEDDVLISPHYRLLDAHADSCEWVLLGSVLDEIAVETELTDGAPASRELKRKLRRMITTFIAPTAEEPPSLCAGRALDEVRSAPTRAEKRERMREYAKAAGSTATSLEALVSCFEELKALGLLFEPLTIKGMAETTYRDFFRPLKYASLNKLAVTYGGCRLYKRYGKGFALKFIDAFEMTPVSLYVPPNIILVSAHATRILKMIDEVEKNRTEKPYLRAYWLGGLKKVEKDSIHYSADISSLSQVTFRLVYPKRSQTHDTTS